MRPDDTERPAGRASTPAQVDHDATRRVRENDLVRELDEFTARHTPPPEIGREREEPRGSRTP